MFVVPPKSGDREQGKFALYCGSADYKIYVFAVRRGSGLPYGLPKRDTTLRRQSHQASDQRDAGIDAGTAHFCRPDARLDLSDMGLAEKKHTQSGLAYTASDRQRQGIGH